MVAYISVTTTTASYHIRFMISFKYYILDGFISKH